MALSEQVISAIQQKLSLSIKNTIAVNGGSINDAWCISAGAGKYFVKINNSNRFPGMFQAEANGLRLINVTSAIAVPDVILEGTAGEHSFLVLDWIDARRPTTKAFEVLGRSLAKMHKNTAGYFGLDHDNYMGSLRQSNKMHQRWSDFFIEERLHPMVHMATDKKLLTSNDAASFERLYKNLAGLFTEEEPSLIHGDLWGGNYLVDTNEKPYLIDPAVSYGNREFDIAMTTLFGGFSDDFYRAYKEAFPLAKGWEGRVDLWNLYPLLVHLNLFGSGYLGQVRDCLRRYL